MIGVSLRNSGSWVCQETERQTPGRESEAWEFPQADLAEVPSHQEGKVDIQSPPKITGITKHGQHFRIDK